MDKIPGILNIKIQSNLYIGICSLHKNYINHDIAHFDAFDAPVQD